MKVRHRRARAGLELVLLLLLFYAVLFDLIQSSPSAPDSPLPLPHKRKAKYFIFHPYKRLSCWKNMTKRYNMIAIKADPAKELFAMYNPTKYPYRHLFPLLDEPAVQLSRHYEEMGPDLTTVPPYAITSMCTNKLAFNQYLRENGFAEYAPKVYASIDKVEKFPVIIKPLNGTGSSNVFAAHSHTELVKYIVKLGTQPYMLQECILNRIQRIVHVTAIDGRMLRMVCYERDLERESGIYPNKWKTTPEAVPNWLCHDDLIRKVLSALKFTGIGDFDIKLRREDGVPQIIEFNPRIPGTVRRDADLLADFICSLQFNGTAVLTSRGCEEP